MVTSALVVAAIVVAAAVVWSALAIVNELRAQRVEAAASRKLDLLTLFSAGIAAVNADPRALLIWQPLAGTARTLYPNEFTALDRTSNGSFPFSLDQLQSAHARWTTEWLTWERAHDTEFKLKTAAAERDLKAPGAGAVERARFDTVEREKLELYQRRYEEYIRVAKALQLLIDGVSKRPA